MPMWAPERVNLCLLNLASAWFWVHGEVQGERRKEVLWDREVHMLVGGQRRWSQNLVLVLVSRYLNMNHQLKWFK